MGALGHRKVRSQVPRLIHRPLLHRDRLNAASHTTGEAARLVEHVHASIGSVQCYKDPLEPAEFSWDKKTGKPAAACYGIGGVPQEKSRSLRAALPPQHQQVPTSLFGVTADLDGGYAKGDLELDCRRFVVAEYVGHDPLPKASHLRTALGHVSRVWPLDYSGKHPGRPDRRYPQQADARRPARQLESRSGDPATRFRFVGSSYDVL